MEEAIAQDKEGNPKCSYSTMRSHFSSFLNGSSKAETLTRVIRNCEGQTPVEIFSHKESTGNAHQADAPAAVMPPQPHTPQRPSFPLPGGDAGGFGAEDVFAAIFAPIVEGILGGGVQDGRGGGAGVSGFGRVFGGAFPGGQLPPGFSPAQDDPSASRSPTYQYPRAPHAYPRGQHRADARGESDVTEI